MTNPGSTDAGGQGFQPEPEPEPVGWRPTAVGWQLAATPTRPLVPPTLGRGGRPSFDGQLLLIRGQMVPGSDLLLLVGGLLWEGWRGKKDLQGRALTLIKTWY